jgi:hypothetical protein
MKKIHPFIRTIAVAICAQFLLGEIAMANPDIRPFQLSREQERSAHLRWAKETLPSVPGSVATLEDAWRAPGHSSSTLILVQDAHTNPSAQFNTAKLLDHVLSFRAREAEKSPHIFLEAGSGEESLSFLRSSSDLLKRKRVAESFLRQGKLQGIEYLDLTSDHTFIPWGVDLPPKNCTTCSLVSQGV